MDLATLIPLVIRASIFLAVFGLGLGASAADTLGLLRRPWLLARSVFAMAVVMPLVAVGLAAAFDLHRAVKVALIALAVSPVPPVLPRKQLGARGPASYVLGLLVFAAVVSIVFVPPAMRLLGKAFGTPLYVPLRPVALVALVTVLVPLTLGMVARRLAPALAERIARPITSVAMGLLLVAVLPVMVTEWPAIVSLIGNGTLAALGAFVIVGLAVGHLLGGPDPDERGVLALATATRHPAIAIAAAHAAFPEQKLVVPAILSYVILAAVLSIPYLVWHRRARPPQASR